MIFPLTLPGTGGSRVQRHKIFQVESKKLNGEMHELFPKEKVQKKNNFACKIIFLTAWMPRRIAVNGTACAENAKGVLYDN